jgi:hypothetical protein
MPVRKGRVRMTRHEHHLYYDDIFEYHGGTMIERVRRQKGYIISRDWIIFDSIEEAQDFFNSNGDSWRVT